MCVRGTGKRRIQMRLSSRLEKGLVNPALDWLAEMSAEEFRENFRGSPIRRAKFAGLRRNVAIAMGNSGRREFVAELEKMSRDPEESVAESAAWAIRKLTAENGGLMEVSFAGCSPLREC